MAADENHITPPPGIDYKQRDEWLWDTMTSLFQRRGFSAEDILRHWPAYILRRDLPRFLAHYELFKKVVDLPGCIVELGVYKGASFFFLTKLMETFCAGDRYRKVFGFDHFEGLKEDQFADQDGAMNGSVKKEAGGYRATADEVRTMAAVHNADNLLPGAERCRLVEGDVMETLPVFLEGNPGLKICYLHMDMDLYKPTKFALELLYPLVVTGGVVCFDEYGLMPWQGETRAVDEFFESFDRKPTIRKFPFIHLPHGYMIKE